MMKRNTLIICILCMALLLSGCTDGGTNEGPNTSTPASSDGKKDNERQCNLDVLQPAAYGNVEGLNLKPGSYISLIGRNSDDEFWKMIKAGAKQAIDDINTMLGYEGNDMVTLTYSAPSTPDSIDEQVNILDEELARYPTAIGIAIVDSSACEVQFDLVAENDIPLVAFESGSDYEGIQAMISTNNTEAAQTAATKLCDAIEDSGDILLFVHDTASSSGSEREQAFLNEISTRHPDVQVADVFHMDNLLLVKQEMIAESNTSTPPESVDLNPLAPEDITDQEALNYIINKYPDVKGCVTTDARTTQELLKVVREAQIDDLQIVGFEGGSKQLDALEAGELTGLVIQNPYGMGYATVIAAARAALGMGNEASVDCGYIWVTKDNMENESIKRMLF